MNPQRDPQQVPEGNIASRVLAELVRIRPNDLLHPFTDPRIVEELYTPSAPDTQFGRNPAYDSSGDPDRPFQSRDAIGASARTYAPPTRPEPWRRGPAPFAAPAPTSTAPSAHHPQTPTRAFSTAITADSFADGLAPLVVGDPGADVDPVIVDAKFGTGRQVPDTVIDGWRSPEFVMRSVSLRGRMHRYNGAPRQDSVLTRLSDDGTTLFVAVADGVSAAPQSHRGSEIAAKYAVGWMLKKYSASLTATDWQSLAKGASYSIQKVARESGADPMDFASTLVCAAVRRDGAGLRGHILSIGDSGSWVVRGSGLSLLEGGKNEGDALISSSAVRPLPVVPDGLDAVYFESRSDETVLLGTDGIGDPLGGGGGPLSNLFVKRLYKRVPSITEFCHLVDFSKAGFDDDRTLVAIWPPHLGLPEQ